MKNNMGKEVFVVICTDLTQITLLDSVWSNKKKALRYVEALRKIDDKNTYMVMPMKMNNKFHQLLAYEDFVPL